MRLDVIEATVRQYKSAPIEELRTYRWLVVLARWPRPIRRAALRLGMDISGRWRARFFGTFCISPTAGLGSAALNLLAPVTTTLWYGPLDDQGRLGVRVAFDHRVIDGAPISRALADLEAVLHDVIAPELCASEPPVARRPA